MKKIYSNENIFLYTLIEINDMREKKKNSKYSEIGLIHTVCKRNKRKEF